MKSASTLWQEISVVNNIKFEFKSLGKDNDIPLLVAKDFFKYPDKVADFFANGYWWDNFTDNNVRPGKSFLIHDEVVQWFITPFVKLPIHLIILVLNGSMFVSFIMIRSMSLRIHTIHPVSR